jgi:hypothetical protein
VKPAAFEEREYEAPLYNQLERGTLPVWSPGQVLEGRVGFDRGLFLTDAALWTVLGYDHVPRGAVLARIRWPLNWGPRVRQRKLPSFRLNLFIQAKRSHSGTRPPAVARRLGFHGRTWGFFVDEEQQTLLDVLSTKSGPRAVVTYAAPVFHTEHDLYGHIIRGSVITNSTFPSATALSAHGAWYYQVPGAIGIANPDPEVIEERALEARIRSALAGVQATADSSESDLVTLAEVVVETAGERRVVRSERFFQTLQTLDRELDRFEIRPEEKAWVQVAAFSEIFGLVWLVVGETESWPPR